MNLPGKQLETALATVDTSLETWRHKIFAELSAIAAKAAAAMHARVNEFARRITLEMGDFIRQTRGEVMFSAAIIDYYAENAEVSLAPQHVKPSSREAQLESTPFGVPFGVHPWNSPYCQFARFASPNLIAGNVVLVKHAGCVSQCAFAFEKLWLEAGAQRALTPTCLYRMTR